MGITRIDHLSAETIHREDSVEFWEGLGFSFVDQWGTKERRADLPGVVTPLSHTHWGSRWIRVADPDGRVHPLEEVL